jgi:REP element-mobilizing transposase RayT
MNKPLVIVYHLMWTAYGHWLPNDPRGSTSRHIASDVIAELGELHRGRCKIQPAVSVLRDFKQRASKVLKYPLLTFSLPDFPVIAEGIASAIAKNHYTCYACSVMPDHVHLLIRKHKHPAETMIEGLQESSRNRVIAERLRPPDHPVWTTGGCKVFLYHPVQIRRTIRYIVNNPVKWHLPRQRWPFIVQYNGWPLHPGHSPNSPYAKGLKNYKLS